MFPQPPAHRLEVQPHLSHRVKSYLWHGLAASTRQTYSTGQKRYLEFLRDNIQYRNTDGSILPASQTAVVEWIADMGTKDGLTPATIKKYIGHLRSLHVDFDIPFDALDSPMVHRVLRGVRRYHSEQSCPDRFPITQPILAVICASRDT
jgi:hypothetical protein